VTTAFIGLGSNLSDPETQLRTALAALAQLPQTRLLRSSSLYRSAPLLLPGAASQPDYLNAVAEIETTLEPEALLAELQALEARQGRVRDQRWGPRTLDLDLLLYGDRVIATAELTVPHAGLYERNFVLYPLAEIVGGQAASLAIPGWGTLEALLAGCPRGSLEKITSIPDQP
jgi:2-amino-4-hydroxy-6-hydroxymethyldihydropteridine diphosphokinase